MWNQSGQCRWFMLVFGVTFLLHGCAGHVDLQQLAKTPDELQALHQFKAEHPEANEEDLTMALEVYRAGRLRKQALSIQFSHQFPKATAEEVNILVDDQMAREGPYPGATPPMDCPCTSAGTSPIRVAIDMKGGSKRGTCRF
jgi:hypothetical protein